jgi:hypothetical protein
MPKREPKEGDFQLWKPYNEANGPWYKAYFKVGGRSITAVIQPDMDRTSWFWSIRIAAYHPRPSTIAKNPKVTELPQRKFGGRATSLNDAKMKAEAKALGGLVIPTKQP